MPSSAAFPICSQFPKTCLVQEAWLDFVLSKYPQISFPLSAYCVGYEGSPNASCWSPHSTVKWVGNETSGCDPDGTLSV